MTSNMPINEGSLWRETRLLTITQNHILKNVEILVIRYGENSDQKNQQQTEVWVYSFTVIYINVLAQLDFIQSFIPVDWSIGRVKKSISTQAKNSERFII